MDMSEVKAFNAELSGLYENKPPISKAKMNAITRGAIKAIKFYKHVVHSVEKFIQKCKPEYKVPGLYVIDSIVRQSRHQFGQDKDVFAPRFAKNMQQTFANLFRCPPEDKRNIIRVLNLWQKNSVFGADVIQPLIDMADPSHPVHQEIQQQNTSVNGSSMNLSLNTTDNRMSPGPAQHTPHISSPGDDQMVETGSAVKFNRKLLNDFEYDSEDDTTHEPPHSANTNINLNNTANNNIPANPPNPADALGSILTNPEIMRQLQSLQAQMQLMTGLQIPNLMPMMSDIQMQNQNQTMPFLNSQDQQKQNESKDELANESDIEFVDAGPQVIEIPDVNDSRSPSPRGRRGRSRSPRRRRRSRTRSRSPRRRRDRDRDRDRDREKDREKSYKEREAEKEKQKEREKKGLPPIKKDNLSVCSTTLWVGHLSKLATPEELSDLFGALGGVVSIDLVSPRGCAFVVMERRRDAAKARAKLDKHKLHSKEITVAWAPGKGVKGREWKDYWEAELGVAYLPWDELRTRWQLGALSLDALEDGGSVDEATLPPWMPPRIIPKVMDNMSMMPPAPTMLPGMPTAMPSMAALPTGPSTALPNAMPTGLPTGLQVPTSIPLPLPNLPPPPMGAGIPPGIAPGIPPGLRPPTMPTGVPSVPGLQTEAGLPPRGPMLGYPPGMPPQSIAQPGMVGGFLGGLLGVGGIVSGVPLQLPQQPQLQQQIQQQQIQQQQLQQQQLQQHQQQLQQQLQQSPLIQQQAASTRTDDAMELDADDAPDGDTDQTVTAPISIEPPALLPDQIQALLSKPPPSFNASEPPPGFNATEPPPALPAPPAMSTPPTLPERHKHEEDKRDRERDRDRRDRDRRDRSDRDRGRDRRDRPDRNDRDRGRDRDRERGERDDRRDRDKDRGRDRRDRDRDRDRERDRERDRGERDRFNNRETNRSKSPRGEKSLQARLWEMANGPGAAHTSAPQSSEEAVDAEVDPREGEESAEVQRQQPVEEEVEGVDRPECGPGGVPGTGMGAWTPLPPPQHMAPVFRAELRMRGPPRPPMRGPWMDMPGPGPFGPRINGMGPNFSRPPFDRPPFDVPMFDGPPRFERPPFNRMPLDSNRPPFEGPPRFENPNRQSFDGPNRPPFEGPNRLQFDGPNRPPFDGPMRPPFDGPKRPPFDGPNRPPFDGPNRPSRPPFDNPPSFDGQPATFEGSRPPFDGPPRQFDRTARFDGGSEFFDRNNRRFDEREQFNDRGWNGDRDRERDWDRRNEWDDRRRDRRPREHDDRFRDRNDRKRNVDDRGDRSERNDRIDRTKVVKDDRASRRDSRKSRWGTSEEAETENVENKENKIEEKEYNQTLNDDNSTENENSHVSFSHQLTENREVESTKEDQEPEKYSHNEIIATNFGTNETNVIEEKVEERKVEEKEEEESKSDNPNTEPIESIVASTEEQWKVEVTNSSKDNVLSLYDENDAVDTSFTKLAANGTEEHNSTEVDTTDQSKPVDTTIESNNTETEHSVDAQQNVRNEGLEAA